MKERKKSRKRNNNPPPSSEDIDEELKRIELFRAQLRVEMTREAFMLDERRRRDYIV